MEPQVEVGYGTAISLIDETDPILTTVVFDCNDTQRKVAEENDKY